MKMRKLVAVLMAVLMLCCIIPFSAMADGNATIDFTDKANRTAYSTQQQVWEQNGITITNDKGASTSNVGDYGGEGYPARFYKSSTVTIEYPGMTSIVIECRDLEAKYVNGWADSAANATATVDGGVVTIVFAEAVDSFTWEPLTSQSRAYSITVITDGSAPIVPDVPVIPSDDPEADTELSIADAIALGASKEHNIYTEGKYFVTGVITEVYNTQYGNMKITDEAGNILTVYGTFSADGELRYDAMDVQPTAGDTVTIYGIIGQYNGTPQIKNGWIVEHTIGEAPIVPDAPAVEVVDAPVAGTAYKFGMIQSNVSESDVYYLIGGMAQTYYLATGTDVNAAIDVYLEETDGGYYCYAMIDGAKTYINMVVNGTHVNGAYEAAPATVYTYDADAKTIIADIDGANYWFGTRNDKNYTTVGPCNVEYAGFYCQFYGVATPDVPVVPDVPTGDTLTIPEANELGLSMEPNTYTEGKYYVTGKIVAISNATYGNMYIVDENNNQFMVYGTYSADGELRYDAMEYMPVVGDTITVYGIIGTYNGTEAQMKNGWITEIVKGDGEPENTDPAADSVLTVKEAIDLGLSKLHNVFTENKYYVTAEITEIYNDIYGNMRVTDADGNILTIYGTYDADGTNRFDAMETQPQVGDTVKFYGIIGQYNGTPQMKNAWIVAINPTDEPVDPDEPSDPVDPDEPSDPDEPGVDSPTTGDNSTVYVTLAVVLMVLAAAAMVLTSKKRA